MIYTKVIIIGGGFGGLNAAKALKTAQAEVILIDKTNHHLFQPLLYQVATAALSPGDIATPIREILRKQDNTSVFMGNVVAIHKREKQIELANGDRVGYDYLVLSVGARHSYFGNEAWEKYAPGLKTISDALKIRSQVLGSFEIAERLDSISEAAKFLNFVVIGGGPAGVEMAGAIAEIAHTTMFKNFRRIKPEKSKIYLVEAADHILPAYPSKLSRSAQKDLEQLGVRVVTGKKVTNITESGVQIGDLFVESENVIWAAGNEASPLLRTLDTPLDGQGRAIVGPDLSLPDHPEIFVIGDAAHCRGKEGKPLPGIASTAIQQGRYVGNLIKERCALSEKKKRPFRYWDKGSMATICRGKAIAMIGKISITGMTAWLAWCFIHIIYLIGFRNRIGVLFDWLFFYATGHRGVRLIYASLDRKIPAGKEKLFKEE